MHRWTLDCLWGVFRVLDAAIADDVKLPEPSPKDCHISRLSGVYRMKGKFKMATTSLDKDASLKLPTLIKTVPTNAVDEGQEMASLEAASIEAASIEAAFDEHWAWVCRTLFHIVGDWDEAEDLALDVFYRLHQHPPKEQEQLGSWLYRVATNAGLNALRARQRRRRHEEAAERLTWQRATPADPALEVERRETQERVRYVLARMQRRRAQLLILRYSGLSYQDIATILNIAPTSVGTSLARAEKDFERRYRALEESHEASE